MPAQRGGEEGGGGGGDMKLLCHVVGLEVDNVIHLLM